MGGKNGTRSGSSCGVLWQSCSAIRALEQDSSGAREVCLPYKACHVHELLISTMQGHFDVPDCVVGWVHLDDIFRKPKHSVRLLVFGHNSSEVGHCFTVLLGVGNRSQWVWAPIVLGYGNDMLPFFRV